MTATVESRVAVLKDVYDRLLSDLAMLSDKSMELVGLTYEDRSDRPVGEGEIHIAFRITILAGGHDDSGVLIVPLRHALALAGYLMMSPDEKVAEIAESTDPDRSVKEAVVEIGSFVAAACDGAMRQAGLTIDRAVFAGCQAVPADVRPMLEYIDGTPLAVGRGAIRIGDRGVAETILALPTSVLNG